MMGEPIDTHFDKRETPQGRHARQVPRSGRHARVMSGASSWSVRRRSLVAAIAVAMVALMILGVLAAHGRAGASGDGDQSAAQEALEAQTLETAYAADDSAEAAQQEQSPHDAEAAEAVGPGMRPDDADGFSRNRRDALGAMGEEAVEGFGRANVMQVVNFTGLSGASANVPELFQYPSMPAGCEIYSLAAVLQAMDHDADPDSIVANQLPFDVEGDDYASAFWGDPYWSGEGMPPAIMAAGNAFLEEAGASERFANLAGTDFDELAGKASSGTPVLVWTTLDFEDPYFDEPLEANSFYDLEHCVVLLGVEGHRACIMDPTQGYVTVNYDWFKYLYEQCGSMALAIA